MTAGGLSAVDIGDPRTVGGIAREYFTRLVGQLRQDAGLGQAVREQGGGPATGGAYSIEPHAAEAALQRHGTRGEACPCISTPGWQVVRRRTAPRIVEFVTEDGTVFRAKVFIDATYEGDLMAKAGVSYTLKREGNAKYGETLQRHPLHREVPAAARIT